MKTKRLLPLSAEGMKLYENMDPAQKDHAKRIIKAAMKMNVFQVPTAKRQFITSLGSMMLRGLLDDKTRVFDVLDFMDHEMKRDQAIDTRREKDYSE